MPELPEGETMVRGLRPALEGYTLESLAVDDPFLVKNCAADVLVARAEGARVEAVSRRGKWVILHLGGDRGLGKGGAERLEASFGLAGTGEIIELLLRHLDLRQRRFLDIAAEGAVHNALAEIDELAAQIEVVDGPPER